MNKDFLDRIFNKQAAPAWVFGALALGIYAHSNWQLHNKDLKRVEPHARSIILNAFYDDLDRSVDPRYIVLNQKRRQWKLLSLTHSDSLGVDVVTLQSLVGRCEDLLSFVEGRIYDLDTIRGGENYDALKSQILEGFDEFNTDRERLIDASNRILFPIQDGAVGTVNSSRGLSVKSRQIGFVKYSRTIGGLAKDEALLQLMLERDELKPQMPEGKLQAVRDYKKTVQGLIVYVFEQLEDGVALDNVTFLQDTYQKLVDWKKERDALGEVHGVDLGSSVIEKFLQIIPFDLPPEDRGHELNPQ